ncbi:hypothetical protein NDU88_009224 [Pleurodeles waltl]|uniref:Uncharacterized protein n=1 Tax=Pleurodeles waltl TaxID=8319 RepID=A0AAV7NYX8_PLEWA|nr:hypothetical protein NDU88_009224 [Pleurodeles waltl]
MEKWPGDTIESVALLWQNIERKQEEDVHQVGREGGGKEDMDEQSERDDYRIPEEGTNECTEAAVRPKTTRKDGEETSESCALTESKKDCSSRVQLWNPTTCHVPEGRGWSTYVPVYVP